MTHTVHHTGAYNQVGHCATGTRPFAPANMTVKSDQEPALDDLMNDVHKWCVESNSQAITTMEHIPVHDSKSEGHVE